MMPPERLAATAPYARFFHRSADAVLADLEVYCAELARWQRVQNLVSRETLPAVWTRHIADSLQLLQHLRPTDRLFVDLGSGGGLPAIPLAIALKGSGAAFRLFEPNSRKVSFLRSVARTLALSAEVLAARADEIDSRETLPPADVITCRALAPLPALLSLAAPFFGPQTHALLHKGREFREEMVESRRQWRYEVVVLASDTSAAGVVLDITTLRAEPAA